MAQPGRNLEAVDPKELTIQAIAVLVSDACIQFSDNSGIVNDPASWLLLHHTILLSHVYGDGGRPTCCSLPIQVLPNTSNRLSVTEKARRVVDHGLCSWFASGAR